MSKLKRLIGLQSTAILSCAMPCADSLHGHTHFEKLAVVGAVAITQGYPLTLLRDRFVTAASSRRGCHPGPRRIDIFCILQRHPCRLPSAGLRDRRQVDVELCSILATAFQ
jgi:hypothetical protein